MHISTATYEEISESLPLLHRSKSVPDLDSRLKSSRTLLLEAVGCVPKSSARFVKKFFTKSHHSQKNTPIAIRVLAQSAEGIAGGLLFLSACSATILWVCNPLAWGIKTAHLHSVNSRIAYLFSVTASDLTDISSRKELLKHQKEYWKILAKLRPKKNLANYCVLNSEERNNQLDELSRILTRRLSLHIDLANLLTEFEKTCEDNTTSICSCLHKILDLRVKGYHPIEFEDNKTSIPTCSRETLALWVKCSQTIEQELQNPTLGYEKTLLTTWERQLTRNGEKLLASELNHLKRLRILITISSTEDTVEVSLREAQSYAKVLRYSQAFKQNIEHIRESLEAKSITRIDRLEPENTGICSELEPLPQPIESFDKELSSLQWQIHNLLVHSLLKALIERKIPFSVDEWKKILQFLEPLPNLNPEDTESSDIFQIPCLAILKERYDIKKRKMLEEGTEDYSRLWDFASLCSIFFFLEEFIPTLQTQLRPTSSAQEGGQSSSSRGPLEEKNLINQRLYCVMQQMSSVREPYLVLLRKYIKTSFDIWNIQTWSSVWDDISLKDVLLKSLKDDLSRLPTEETTSGPTVLELTTGLFTVIETMHKVNDMSKKDPQELLEMFKGPIAKMRKVCPEFPQHVLLLGNSPLSPEEKSKLRIRIIQNFFKDTSLSYTSLAKAKTELMSQLHLDHTDSMTQELDLAFTCETKMREYFASITQ